jgi:dipeptidase E
MRLLLISNSTNSGEPYLEYPKIEIKNFLGKQKVKALFIPYAAVTFTYDLYEKKISEKFLEIGHDIISIHHFSDPVLAIENASALVVGGGNTWKLLKTIRDNHLIDIIRQKVVTGTPYIGWSAGSNLACPTIKTTNDMPVDESDSMEALNLIPFQINPHYTDLNPVHYAGETREQRIEEFIEVNPGVVVTGLREGTMLIIEDKKIKLIGPNKMRIFKKGIKTQELSSSDDLSFLLDRI